MATMSVSKAFVHDVFPLSDQIWRTSCDIRGYLHHGTGRCPQRAHPFAADIHDVLCDRCCELHQHALVIADRRVTLWREHAIATGTDPVTATAAATRRLLANVTSVILEARDQYDAARGLATKVSQLSERARWFTDALPDPLDREIVTSLLYFARGGDRCEGGQVPIERMAERHELDAHQLLLRLSSAIETLRAVRADWVERNIDGPLSERLCEAGAPRHEATWDRSDDEPLDEMLADAC